MALIRSPVQEVAFSVQRRTSTPVNALDVADLRSRLASRYPLFQQTEALPPLNVALSVDPIFHFEPVELRYWMLSEDSKLLVQFQHDRVALNWRRLAPTSIPAEYPGYETLKLRFLAELGVVDTWLREGNHDTAVTSIELFYMNGVEIGERRISDILRFFKPAAKRAVASFQFNMASPISESAPERGYISTNCGVGTDVHGAPNLLVNFTGRTIVDNGVSVADSFDLLHDMVLASLGEVFTSSVLEDAHVS